MDLPILTKSTGLRWLRAGTLLAALILLAAAAPLIWLAVATGAGLLVLGAIALLATSVLLALPLLGQKLENRLLAARSREAQESPIEQMRAQLLQRQRQLQQLRDALTSLYAQIEGMRDMLHERRRAEPGQDLAKQEHALEKMTAFYTGYVARHHDAHQALQEFRRHLEARLFEWNFAQAGKHVLHHMDPNEQENVLREVLCDEASRSVQAQFNRVFAELELERQGVDVQTRHLADAARVLAR
jgi:membrane protein implicated in regulation of membrane protease activity